MGRFKTIQCENTVRRMFIDGVLKVNSVDKDKNYKVSLMLLNGLRNRNGWVYENIEQNIAQFVNIPILCAWVRGKPDGHNFDMKIDPKTGEEYASFVAADAEKIIGWINAKTPDGADNAYIANVNGVDWVCVREAFIPSFYNKEFIDSLEAQGGQMKVSIETLVNKFRVEGDTEYEEDWTVVGVTVISVTEAVAGANIKKKVNASYGEELKKIKLRAAQYYAETHITEPQTQGVKNKKEGETKTMKRMLNLADLVGKFDGYTVVGVQGSTVALLSAKGRTCTYTFLENENTVVPERIEQITVNSVFGDGDNAVTVTVDDIVSALQAKLNALQNALDETTKEKADLTAKLNKMEEAEHARRIEAVRSAITNQMEANRANSDVEIASNLCEDMLSQNTLEMYAGKCDANGLFCGEEEAKRDVDARCMATIRAENKAKAAANAAKKNFSWLDVVKGDNDSAHAASDGILSSLDRIMSD